MRLISYLGAAVVLLAVSAGVARAQGAPTDRARVSLNVGIQPASASFTGTTTSTVYLEQATINTTYRTPSGLLFDGGAVVRVAGNFGVGIAVSSFSKSQDAPVTGTIPHPFFFATLRPLSGTATGLQHRETAVHLQATYELLFNRLSIVLAAGPSFFSVSQDLVSDVSYTEVYPFDTVTFTSATTKKVTASKVGFNVGADIGITLAPHVGVGALVRFSRASVSFPLDGSAAGVDANAGGIQAAAGLRLFF